ncbi:MAG TPA: exodeoxyribonuclease VII small subunit [Firmicutes bacterium]|nr:exodeoxyribonuclease VII small subunit [Bacillota bacterium]
MTELCFEDALKRLEEIVAGIEKGDLRLDEMLKLYEEGMALSKYCMDKLNEAERKVLRVVRGEDGTPVVREIG